MIPSRQIEGTPGCQTTVASGRSTIRRKSTCAPPQTIFRGYYPFSEICELVRGGLIDILPPKLSAALGAGFAGPDRGFAQRCFDNVGLSLIHTRQRAEMNR